MMHTIRRRFAHRVGYGLFLLLVCWLFSSGAAQAETFDGDGGTFSESIYTEGDNIDGVTMTVNFSGVLAFVMDMGGSWGTSGSVILSDLEPALVTFSFSQPVAISSFQFVDVYGYNGPYTFTVTDGTGSAIQITSLPVDNGGTTVSPPDWSAVTTFTVSCNNSLWWGPGFDTIDYTTNDEAAPVFQNSTPSLSGTTISQTTLTVRLDEPGTAYYVAVADGAGAPSVAQVKAGLNAGGGAALKSGSISVTSAGSDFSANITGLSSGTAYDIYVVAEDSIPNVQAGVTKVDLTTLLQNSDGNLTAAAGVSEPVGLSTTVDTLGEAVGIFDFTLSDGGGSDGLPLAVSQIVVHVSGTSTDIESGQITWRLNGPDASNVAGAYNAGADTITFSGLTISVANGGNETYTLNVHYNDNTNLTEDHTLILSVDGDTDLTVGAAGTQMGATAAVTNGTGSTMDVAATQLVFSTQPAGAVSGSTLSTQPVVAARDAFGNLDVDFSEVITLTEASAGSLSGNTAAAVNGVATFTNLTYTATADQQSFTLTANDQDGVGSDLATVNANALTADVVATRLRFATEPAPTTLLSGATASFTTVPVVQAVDVNNVVDTGYATDFVLSVTDPNDGTLDGTVNSLTATGDTDGNATTVSLTPSSGAATFTSLSLAYTTAGGTNTIALRAASGGLSAANSSAITCRNTPALAISGTTLAYTEGDAAPQIDSTATLIDADGDADWNGGSLSIQITANAEAGDRLSIADTDGDGTAITISNTNILSNGTHIGDLSAADSMVSGGTALTITFDADASNPIVQEVLQSMRYESTSNDPGTANRTVTVTATDNAAANASDTRTISVTAVNDEPALSATGSHPTFTEDGAAAVLYSGSAVSTVEAGQTISALTVTVTNVTDGDDEIFSLDGTTVALTNGTSGTTATNSLNYSVSIAGTTATLGLTGGALSTDAAQTLVNGMRYRNTSQDPAITNRVVTLTSLKDSGGTANGGDDTASPAVSSTVTIQAINDAPVITDQAALTTFGTNPLTITLDELTVSDPDNTYPGDFTLAVQDGAGYSRSGATITPASGFAGNLTVGVQVNDGSDFSSVYNLIVYVASALGVLNTDDSGPGSLRQIIADAADGDEVDLTGLTGTIVLTSGPLVIDKDLTLTGPETGLVISGNFTGRVLTISDAAVSLSDLTIQDGLSAGDGGGIYATGALTLNRVTIVDNAAAGNGGGVYSSGTLMAVNCTFSGNSADGSGGAIANIGTAVLNHCTLADNAATAGAGGIANSGILQLTNSLIAGNIPADCANAGTLAVNSHNLVADNTCTPALSGDPLLGVLQDNGGSGMTHALGFGSAAIDVADPGSASAEDQRGVARPVDGDGDDTAAADIGAYEFRPGTLQFSAVGYTVGESGATATITVSRLDGDDGQVSADYATADGTATAGSDYTAASGTLTWAGGNAADQSFTITILNDAAVEGSETIPLTLNNFSGNAQVDPDTAQLTILDDEVEITDHDGDGIDDDTDEDDDNDGMPDLWEVANGLDPLSDDADQDEDSDGLSNLQEYVKGSDPLSATTGPGIPVLVAPDDQAVVTILTPELQSAYADGATIAEHAETCWQVAADAGFTSLVFQKTTSAYKTDIPVPHGTLDEGTTYYWRDRYIDSDGAAWAWSSPWSFSTAADITGDDNGNGIPDADEAMPGTDVDLDGDGQNDLTQPDMQIINQGTEHGLMGVKSGAHVVDITELSRMDAADIADQANRPADLPMGLFSFRLQLDAPGRATTATVYFSTPLPEEIAWYKYDLIDGWADYSAYATISADRKSVVLELEDGGIGDADGVANGVIVDPSGPAVPTASPPSIGGSGGGGCFIDMCADEESIRVQPVIALLAMLAATLFGNVLRKQKMKRSRSRCWHTRIAMHGNE